MANPYILAAENPAALLTFLSENPTLASGQDEHGYSLLHAAASYNHLDLLRALVRDYNVDVNIRDEDQETALFVVETIAAAKVLVEELGINILARNEERQTAMEKISEEADFPEVVVYLRTIELERSSGTAQNWTTVNGHAEDALPPQPEGMSVRMGTMEPFDENDLEVDPEFRRRIEELAQREDFDTEAGQADLRQLVQDALAERDSSDRNVRPRQD
jgi:uncharacterized protein